MRELPLILQLDVGGNPVHWITYEEAAYYHAKDLIAWSIGSEGYTIWGGDNRVTGERSSMDLNTIIAVRGEMKESFIRRTPTLTNRALFRRDQNICAYCAEEFPAESLTRDHVTPVSRGGKDVWKNVVTCCSGCNRSKDNMLPHEAKMELLYVPYAPCRAEWLILQNRKILADQMDFLKARLPKESHIITPIDVKSKNKKH